MLETGLTTKWYMVDITDLFLRRVSQRALELTVEYIGSLTALTDLCSHIAMLSLRGIEPNVQDMVTNYILPNVADQRAVTAINSVVTAYTEILINNFFHMEIRRRDISYLNNVVIRNVKEILPTVTYGDIPPVATVAILAEFQWTNFGKTYDIQKYTTQRI